MVVCMASKLTQLPTRSQPPRCRAMHTSSWPLPPPRSSPQAASPQTTTAAATMGTGSATNRDTARPEPTAPTATTATPVIPAAITMTENATSRSTAPRATPTTPTSGGDAPALDNTSVGDFVLHIAGCLFSGVMSMISSVFTMLDMLNSVSDSSLMTVCNGIVSRLEGAGTSRCDPGTLCGATGLLAEECDAIFMAVCILSDDVSNPCAWLLNEVTGGSANICQTIADELHAAGQEEGSNCAAPSSGACLENGRVDDDCCIGSGNRYSCASGGDGVLSTSCSLFGAQLLCCNGAGGGGGGGGGDPCQYAGDGECDVPAYCSSGDYVDCGHSCRYDADGECDDGSHGGTAYCDAGTDCGDCHNCHGSGHRRSMLDAFDPKTAKLARPTGSEPWADGAYKGVPVVIYEVVLAAMLKEIGQDQPGGNLPLATVMKNWDKRRLSGGK